MNFYLTLGRVFRFVIAAVLLISAVSYIQESTCDIKLVEVSKKLEGEFSVQLDLVGLTLALNDSTFMLKVEA